MWGTFAEKKHNKHLSTPFTNTLHLVIACLVFWEVNELPLIDELDENENQI
jgi:hypothetical protein